MWERCSTGSQPKQIDKLDLPKAIISLTETCVFAPKRTRLLSTDINMCIPTIISKSEPTSSHNSQRTSLFELDYAFCSSNNKLLKHMTKNKHKIHQSVCNVNTHYGFRLMSIFSSSYYSHSFVISSKHKF